MVARDAAEHEHGRNRVLRTSELADVFFDLNGQLAGRREDQRTSGHRTGLAGEGQKAGENGQAESGGLARTGLGNAHQVLAFEQLGNGLGLNFGGLGEPGSRQAISQDGGQTEGDKIGQCNSLSAPHGACRRAEQSSALVANREMRVTVQQVQSGDRFKGIARVLARTRTNCFRADFAAHRRG